MTWAYLLFVPFPGAIVIVPVLCLASAAGTVRGWLRRGKS